MLPFSQLILLVILIVLALLMLNWETTSPLPTAEEADDDGSRIDALFSNREQN